MIIEGDEFDDKPAYPNFEGIVIDGERVPTKKDIINLPDHQFYTAHPFVKKSCQDCKYLLKVRSWWCQNEKAIKARGTSRAGCIFCTYWEPDWREIPDKYKLVIYGYGYDMLQLIIKRYTVIPHYKPKHDEIIGYVLWDKAGERIVDNYGKPILSNTYDINDRKNRYMIENNIHLDLLAEYVCNLCDELNNTDIEYTQILTEYSKLTFFQKILKYFYDKMDNLLRRF